MKTFDRRSLNGKALKKECKCGHGIAIHHPKRAVSGHTHPCGHPQCGCKDFQFAKGRSRRQQ